jgi:cytoskeletal protein RodZ
MTQARDKVQEMHTEDTVIQDTASHNANSDDSSKKIESLTTGQYLKKQRLEKKLNLGAISKALCIRKDYLSAIETSTFEDLPALSYTMGFVRSYAGYMDLPAPELVLKFKQEYLHGISPSHELPYIYQTPMQQKPSSNNLTISLVLLVVLGILWYAFHKYSSHQESIPANLAEETPATEDTTESYITVSELPAASATLKTTMDNPSLETSSFNQGVTVLSSQPAASEPLVNTSEQAEVPPSLSKGGSGLADNQTMEMSAPTLSPEPIPSSDAKNIIYDEHGNIYVPKSPSEAPKSIVAYA